MAIVTAGFGVGCVVTRGYGCPEPFVDEEPKSVCDLASPVDKQAFIVSEVNQSIWLMSFVDMHVEVSSMAQWVCDLKSLVHLDVHLESRAQAIEVIDLVSTIDTTVILASRIGCCRKL